MDFGGNGNVSLKQSTRASMGRGRGPRWRTKWLVDGRMRGQKVLRKSFGTEQDSDTDWTTLKPAKGRRKGDSGVCHG